MADFRTSFSRFVGIIYGKLVWLIAYGPWGKRIHSILISLFKKVYAISWQGDQSFKTLGEFFLRDLPLVSASAAPLISPAEAMLIDGPGLIAAKDSLRIKGLHYQWLDFKELDMDKYHPQGMFWNFYLAPNNYHWVHAAAAGTHLQAIRVPGALWPVNTLGRFFSPQLYTVNERLTFKFQTAEFGEVAIICVGAIGVSALMSVKGDVNANGWRLIDEEVKKGERLLGFKLGSTVILLIEKPVPSPKLLDVVEVGNALC